MRQSVAGRWLAASCLVLLAACGGGGGGGDSSLSMSFSPSKVTGSVRQGEVGTLTTTATVQNPDKITDQAWVVIEDGQHMLTGLNIAAIDKAHFSATLYTSQTLALGHQTGTFSVHVCKDQQCSQEWMSPTPLAYDIDVEAAPMQAVPTSSTQSTVAWKGTDTDVVALSITGGTQWTASSGASWLVNTGSASGSSPAAIAFGFAPGQLAEGDYTTAITVRDSPSGQSVDIPVTLHVIAPQFVIDAGGAPVFTAINGAPIAPQPFSFELDSGVPSLWSLVSGASWLEASATSGTTPANLMLDADPSIGALAAGNYDGTLTLSSTGVANKSVDAHLQLIQPTLSLSMPSITLGGDRGRDLVTPQTVQLSLNTGTNAYPVSMSASAAGVSISPASPVVGQSGTTLTLTPDTANLAPGSTSRAVTFTSTVNGDTVTAPLTVNINVDQRRLLPSSWAVGFASTPLGTVTTRTLHVTDNYGGAIAWTATSDSAWLTATAAGTTPAGALVLTADPTLVPTDVVSVAKVRIASSTPGVASNDINVAIWKSASGPTAVTSLPGNMAYEIVADKMRPYIYANSGGSTIMVYNAYTASVVGTINTPGTALGQMAVGPDASRLYAVDNGTNTIQVVYLDQMTWGDQWPMTGAAHTYPSIAAARPDGYEVVMLGDGEIFGAGRQLSSLGISAPGHMSVTDDGGKVYSIDNNVTPPTVTRWFIDHSDIAGGVVYVGSNSLWPEHDQGLGADVAVSPDGSMLVSAAYASVTCSRLDPASLSFLGGMPGVVGNPNNVEITWDNRVICGIDGVYAGNDLWVFTAAGTVKASYKFTGYAHSTLKHAMSVTPDGLIVVVPTDDPQLTFIPIGP